MLAPSLTRAVTVNVPDAVGVPEMNPVLGETVRPGGSPADD